VQTVEKSEGTEGKRKEKEQKEKTHLVPRIALPAQRLPRLKDLHLASRRQRSDQRRVFAFEEGESFGAKPMIDVHL
tara:strand:+ start:745 stop:972 length:228 start_codon:yes stop_codon:yes gene_type:complete